MLKKKKNGGGGGSYKKMASKKKVCSPYSNCPPSWNERGTLRTGLIAVGVRTSGHGGRPRVGKTGHLATQSLGPGAPPNMSRSWKKGALPMSVIYKATWDVLRSADTSMMVSALPVIRNLDFQLMNTEQFPQCLCFMVLNSWIYLWDTTSGLDCYYLFLTWLLVHIFQSSEDLLEKLLCYFLGWAQRCSFCVCTCQSSLNFKATLHFQEICSFHCQNKQTNKTLQIAAAWIIFTDKTLGIFNWLCTWGPCYKQIQ